MSKPDLQAIRGMNDILPHETPIWQSVETILCEVFKSYGYEEIRFPILEKTELFSRSIGEITDIVEKEMYTFTDRNGDSLTLRPEGTAGCIRALLEHGLIYKQERRIWYEGPMFRHERPQKGRYREFHQVGVEVIGFEDPSMDVELIAMSARLWHKLGIESALTLEIGTLGNFVSRTKHKEALVDYFTKHLSDLDEDSRRRLHTNPLRILDSKNPKLIPLIQAAPQIQSFLDPVSIDEFNWILSRLDTLNIAYRVNPSLVRGLDYYSKTVFEWTAKTKTLGAQNTVCGGGRYDKLIEQLGGEPNFAAGFAIGLERLIALMEENIKFKTVRTPAKVFLASIGIDARLKSFAIVETLRDHLPHLCFYHYLGEGSLKSQFKKADKSGATIALILGPDEIANQKITLKFLREDKPQVQHSLNDLIEVLRGNTDG